MRTVGMSVGGKTVRKDAVKAAPAQGDQGGGKTVRKDAVEAAPAQGDQWASGPEGKKPAPKAAKKAAAKNAKEPEGAADEGED